MTHFHYLFVALLFFLPFNAHSQDSTANVVPEHSLLPLLKEMNYGGKVKVVDYIRYITQNIDQEIQYSFDRLNEEDRAKVIQFVYAELSENAIPFRTTVEWAQDTVDLGYIPEGHIVSGRFPAKNTGPNPYLIFGTDTPCGCMVLSHSIYPVTQGNENFVHYRFDSRGRDGDFIFPIFIYDNSRPNSRKILYIKGIVSKRR